MLRKAVFPALFFLALSVAVLSIIANADALMMPMLMSCLAFLALWLFRPDRVSPPRDKAGFRAIMAFAAVSVLTSLALSILVPIYGEAWSLPKNPEDPNGIIYPIVNDGRENCAIGSLVILFYIAFGVAARFRRAAA